VEDSALTEEYKKKFLDGFDSLKGKLEKEKRPVGVPTEPNVLSFFLKNFGTTTISGSAGITGNIAVSTDKASTVNPGGSESGSGSATSGNALGFNSADDSRAADVVPPGEKDKQKQTQEWRLPATASGMEQQALLKAIESDLSGVQVDSPQFNEFMTKYASFFSELETSILRKQSKETIRQVESALSEIKWFSGDEGAVNKKITELVTKFESDPVLMEAVKVRMLLVLATNKKKLFGDRTSNQSSGSNPPSRGPRIQVAIGTYMAELDKLRKAHNNDEEFDKMVTAALKKRTDVEAALDLKKLTETMKKEVRTLFEDAAGEHKSKGAEFFLTQLTKIKTKFIQQAGKADEFDSYVMEQRKERPLINSALTLHDFKLPLRSEKATDKDKALSSAGAEIKKPGLRKKAGAMGTTTQGMEIFRTGVKNVVEKLKPNGVGASVTEEDVKSAVEFVPRLYEWARMKKLDMDEAKEVIRAELLPVMLQVNLHAVNLSPEAQNFLSEMVLLSPTDNNPPAKNDVDPTPNDQGGRPRPKYLVRQNGKRDYLYDSPINSPSATAQSANGRQSATNDKRRSTNLGRILTSVENSLKTLDETQISHGGGITGNIAMSTDKASTVNPGGSESGSGSATSGNEHGPDSAVDSSAADGSMQIISHLQHVIVLPKNEALNAASMVAQTHTAPVDAGSGSLRVGDLVLSARPGLQRSNGGSMDEVFDQGSARGEGGSLKKSSGYSVEDDPLDSSIDDDSPIPLVRTTAKSRAPKNNGLPFGTPLALKTAPVIAESETANEQALRTKVGASAEQKLSDELTASVSGNGDVVKTVPEALTEVKDAVQTLNGAMQRPSGADPGVKKTEAMEQLMNDSSSDDELTTRQVPKAKSKDPKNGRRFLAPRVIHHVGPSPRRPSLYQILDLE
jgi:hypothetical protein